MTQSSARNYKALRRDLDPQRDPIEEGRILTNGILVSRYQNCNRMTMEITGWCVKEVSR